MRTYIIHLVQIAGLLVALGGAIPARSTDRDYGAGANTGANETAGTVITMPGDNHRSGATTPHARVDTPPPAAVATPTRGMTMAGVLARYGAPVRRHAAVGRPPITRWDYPDYRLYFEYNRVLHAVRPQTPEPIVHKNSLSTARP